MPGEAIEKLKERLSSPRLKAPGTIIAYTQTAERFLKTLKRPGAPTPSDLRQYFIMRRKLDIGERTLQKEFAALKKLCEANGWEWPFKKEDVPYFKDEGVQPAQTEANINKMIAARDELSKVECFYLAVASTFGCRRVELTRLRKRDYDNEEIALHLKGLEKTKIHMMPPVLLPIMNGYHPDATDPSTLNKMYKRICLTAGVESADGESWHAVRRSVYTLLQVACAAKYQSLTMAAEYMGWSNSRIGQELFGAQMAGTYLHTEILSTDPYYQDKLIYAVHPFLKLWEGKIPKAFRKEA